MTLDDLKRLFTRQTLFRLDAILSPKLVPILYALGLAGGDGGGAGAHGLERHGVGHRFGRNDPLHRPPIGPRQFIPDFARFSLCR